MVTSWKGSQQNGTVSSGRKSLSSMLLRGRPYLPSLPLRRRPESRDDRHHSGVYLDTGKSRHHAAGPIAIADRVLGADDGHLWRINLCLRRRSLFLFCLTPCLSLSPCMCLSLVLPSTSTQLSAGRARSQITLEDDYPSRVCEKCVETLDKFHHYRRRCLENDRILKSQRSNSSRVRVKQEPEQLDDEPGSPPTEQRHDQPAQQVKQEDSGGSSILRSILLQVREAGRAASTASAELEPEQDVPETPEPKQEELPVDEVDAAVAPSSLLQQMLLQQQTFSRELNQSPAQAGPSHPGPSPSLLKRMLLEGGGAPSPLEGPSHRHDDQRQTTQSPQQPPPTNHHHQQHDENHNEEHSETPLASQLRAILLQHRAAAAAAAAGSAASASTGAATPGEKPEVSYLRSLFLRNDSDGNEDSDSESAVAAATAAAAAAADEPSRELLFSMFQELRARNEVKALVRRKFT